jgi:hypothetical protein
MGLAVMSSTRARLAGRVGGRSAGRCCGESGRSSTATSLVGDRATYAEGEPLLCFGFARSSLAGTDEVGDAESRAPVAHRGAVVAAAEVQRLDVGEQTTSMVGSNSTVSWRLAPSVAQPSGMPLRSVNSDRFQPDLPLSVGFGSVPSPPEGAFSLLPSTAFAQVELDDPVVGGQRLRVERLEHPGREPLVAAPAQGRVRHPVADEALSLDPRAARRQADQDP